MEQRGGRKAGCRDGRQPGSKSNQLKGGSLVGTPRVIAQCQPCCGCRIGPSMRDVVPVALEPWLSRAHQFVYVVLGLSAAVDMLVTWKGATLHRRVGPHRHSDLSCCSYFRQMRVSLSLRPIAGLCRALCGCVPSLQVYSATQKQPSQHGVSAGLIGGRAALTGGARGGRSVP